MLFTPILQASPNFLAQWVPLIFIMAVVYFLMIRPQQKKAKEQKSFMDALAKGDFVATGSGIVGKITKIDGKTIQIETAGKTHIDVISSTVNKEMTDFLNAGEKG
ncbi:MAG TPA: preprotein translocase subunit YajC [Saprospirales bacterium]|jgi:preprotein translocase subunit YajC|nr:preprotein translocase subunit YajC [Saprospiraceae bacterium]HAV28810.1 preprotein translocase subunit YajC [Saprospirales bacterium]HAW05738.1 preprotein translocase subunit YajC [Saprospirales bacterium]